MNDDEVFTSLAERLFANNVQTGKKIRLIGFRLGHLDTPTTKQTRLLSLIEEEKFHSIPCIAVSILLKSVRFSGIAIPDIGWLSEIPLAFFVLHTSPLKVCRAFDLLIRNSLLCWSKCCPRMLSGNSSVSTADVP